MSAVGKLPPHEANPHQTSWRTVAVKLMGPLFSSWSAEVLTAALEGVHALVAADPSVISDLATELSTEWQRYWLLHAAECWAVLHPNELVAIRPSLTNWLGQGSLVERLQSWIVLCNHADATGSARPEFPLQPPVARSLVLLPGSPALLETPGVPLGLVTLSDSQSAARGVLLSLSACGWDFTEKESQVADALGSIQQVSHEVQRRRPRRYEDFYCHDLRTEEAVGRAVLPVLTSDSCDPSGLSYLAQGFLDNDDPWLQRCPPRRASNAIAWPAQDRYDESSAVPDGDVQQTLLHIASLDVPPGWRTFAARVSFCTSNRDFVLDLWYESSTKVTQFSTGRKPYTLSGRTFLWWLGKFFEPGLPHDVSFVSGFFVGGRQRLSHDHLEVLPSQQWRDRFSWHPDRTDPLAWRNKGERVAFYDRLHGPLRDMPQSPNYRQPIIDRWVISDAAFAQVENVVGPLRQRHEFRSEAFRA